MATISQDLSKKLTRISAASMIAVVLIHAYNYTNTYLEPATLIAEGLHWGACVEYFLSNALLRFAVPLFFAMSGFLFFVGRPFSPSFYLRQVRKRLCSVLGVYLLFVLLSLLICRISTLILMPGEIPMFDQVMFRLGQGTGGWLYSIFIFTPAPQLWFLLQLFMLTLASPIVYMLLSRLKLFGLAVLFAGWLVGFTVHIGSFTLFNADAYLFFSLGAFIALNAPRLDFILKKSRKNAVGTIIILSWIVLCAVYTVLCAVLKERSWVQIVLFKLFQLLGVAAVWLGYDRLSDRFADSRPVQLLSDNNFFIFLLHEPILHMVYLVVRSRFPSDAMHMLLYFGFPAVLIAALALTGEFLHRRFPRISRVITGGRR